MALRRRPAWRRFLRTSLRVFVVLALGLPVFAASAVAVALGGLVYGLPGVGDLEGTVPQAKPEFKAQPSKVFLANPDGTPGEQIAEFRQFDITLPMKPEDVPQVLKDAVVASEDRSFWTHKGVDPAGMARAFYTNYTEGEIQQGGSTITQQLVRERYLSRDKTVERKFNEVLLATRFERDLASRLKDERHLATDAEGERAAKEEILFEYLDQVAYFGAGAYGAQAAAQTYFHKDVKDLTLSEAALLVSIIPAPSKYGPRENLAVAEQRRRNVLREMRDVGSIKTDEELNAALDQSLWYAAYGPPPKPMTVIYPPPAADYGRYPYYVDYIRTYLLEKYGPDKLYRGGLTIIAAIDPRMQELAQQNVNTALAGTGPPLEMSLVSVDPPTGQVKALIGGRDWNASQVNLALGGVQGMQPGSSIKAVTVAKALEEGYSPETVYDAPGVFYVPGCSGKCGIRGGTGGPTTLREATAQSVNTYFAQLILDLGPDNVAELANRLGITRITLDRHYTLGLTLGAYEVSPMDMAAAFSVFANHGVKPGVTPVAKVIDSNGTVLEDNTVPHGKRVLNAAVADWTTDLLRGVVSHGTGTRANIGRPVAGKTGSAQEYRAAWFVGYTPQLTTAIWMGYSDAPKPLLNIGGFGQVMGGTVPAKTFSSYMKAALEPFPVVDFTPPGILPPPSSGVRHIPKDAAIPDLPADCDGPCIVGPTLTSPTTQPPDPACDGKDDGAVIDNENAVVCVAGHKETTTTRPRTGAPTTTVTAPKPTRGSP